MACDGAAENITFIRELFRMSNIKDSITRGKKSAVMKADDPNHPLRGTKNVIKSNIHFHGDVPHIMKRYANEIK